MWKLEHNRARLQSASLAASLDIRNPGAGLSELRLLGHPLADVQPLQIQLPATGLGTARLSDCYVRGGDLVTSYDLSPQRDLRAALYWRWIEPSDAAAAAIEVILSVETDRLDVQPTVHTTSQIVADEVFSMVSGPAGGQFEPTGTASVGDYSRENAAGAFLFRVTDSTWSYVEMVFPGDFGAAELSLNPGTPNRRLLRCDLFSEHLEKGVIRRGRLRAAWVPRENDRQRAVECYRDFVRTPPPLTA